MLKGEADTTGSLHLISVLLLASVANTLKVMFSPFSWKIFLSLRISKSSKIVRLGPITKVANGDSKSVQTKVAFSPSGVRALLVEWMLIAAKIDYISLTNMKMLEYGNF